MVGDYCVGSLCGYNVLGIVSNCYSSGSVNGNINVGGLCGQNVSGMISNCYSIGSASGTNYVGGFCGQNHGTITYCYSTGSADGSSDVGGCCGKNYYGTITYCYSTGSARGISSVGGFCGYRFGTGIIGSCLWDVDASGISISSGGVGKTTVEMQAKSTFTDAGWDFDDTWYMAGYPELRGFISEGSIQYQNWLIDLEVPVDKQGYSDDPAGDEIQNLLKYAIGLNPVQSCSAADVMEPLSETNEFGIIFHMAKSAEDVELLPTWTDSLLITNWQTSGFKFEMISETSSNETWKATLPMTNDCGYIRLNAKTEQFSETKYS